MTKTCQPPVADTRTPDVAPPPLACDAHCHVFGPAAVFPYDADRPYTPPDASVEDFRRLQSILGFERAVIVQATCHGTDNAAMLDAVASSGGSYRGVAMVDDGFSDNDFRDLHDGGVRGVRMSFARHLAGPPDFTEVRRTADMIRPMGWHLVLHLEAVDVVENAHLLGALRVPIVIDHMARLKPEQGVGQEAFQLLLGFVRDEGFWVKVTGAERMSATGAPFHDLVPFAQALIEAAPDRILWGTDWPHPNINGVMPNDGDLVDLLALYAPDEETRRRILVDNPARLYGFEA